MELDKSILPGKKYLDCFDTEKAKAFIGKECYTTDRVSSFAYIDTLNKGTLANVDDGACNPYRVEGDGWTYTTTFILPCEWVRKEESAPKHIDFEAAKNDKNFELCKLYGEELLFDTKNNIFYTSDGNIHGYLTAMEQHRAQEEQTKEVIEKKYRAFTLNEFLEQYDVGDLVDIRRNGYEEVEHAMFTGYVTSPDESDDKNLGEYQIIIGGMHYSFTYLFDYYELFYMGHWQPFGILEE